MTANVTLSELQTLCRNRGELRAPYITDTELTAMINAAIADIHRMITKTAKTRLMTRQLIDIIATHTGTGDSIAISDTTCTLTDAGATFTSQDVGREITISGCANAGNNGTFVIATVPTSTTCTYENADGTGETVALSWSIEPSTYNLPSDFFQLVGVDLKLDTGTWCNCEQFDWGKRNTYEASGHRRFTAYSLVGAARLMLNPTPDWTETSGLRVWYVPYATQLSASSDTWDSVTYWHEYVLLKVQMMACAKSGEDPSIFQQLINTMIQDLEASFRVNRADPPQIRDVYAEYRTRPHHGLP